MIAKVELTLGATRPTLNRVIVDGVDLAKVVRSVKVEADPTGIPQVTLELLGEQIIKADADVHAFVGGGTLKHLLASYRAQHTEYSVSPPSAASASSSSEAKWGRTRSQPRRSRRISKCSSSAGSSLSTSRPTVSTAGRW